MDIVRSAAVLLVLLAPPALAQAQVHDKAPVVRVASGSLMGVRTGDTVSFRNIPYAAPPVGDLRWRAPQPARPWSGVRPADKPGAICQQKYNAQDNGVGPLPMSEDCLTLNVFAPARASNVPVMFWLHGGGFVNGSGTAALYDGAALARQGVLVVTINYRLGRFGFFAHPELTAAAKGEPVGNYALMDMIAALKWVRANVAKFGGDPAQVTIFGESAGGVAVNDLMVSPAARGLFVRGISQSGLGREQTLPLADAERAGAEFAAKTGLKDAKLADLRKLTPEQILAAGDINLFGGGAAMLDGKILTVGPLEGFRAGRQARVPFIIGWNSLEFPAPAAALATQPAGSVLDAAALARIKAAYPDAAAYEQHLVSDVIFTEPAYALAKLHAARGNPTFVYQMSVLPKALADKLKGTPHALDRDYVFHNLIGPVFGSNDAVQARVISGHWANFAKTGNPNGGGRASWPLFVSQTGMIVDFTNDGPNLADVPRRAGLDALAATYRTAK
jgi:para-nitrobenzyl esterase